MGRTSLIILAVALLLSGMLFVALKVQEKMADPFEAETYTVVATPYGSVPAPIAVPNPEWEELREHIAQGSEGWEGLRSLMASTDPMIAPTAAGHLVKGGLEAIDHFLLGLPTIDASMKDYIGQDDFNDDVWQRVVEVVANQEEELLEGAAYFLRIENGDLYNTALTEGEVGDMLVASIPGAKGVYAKVLPMTLKFYAPDDFDALTDLLSSRDEQDRLIAVRTLGKMGLEETLPDVRKLKTDSAKAVRSAAITAEASIDSAVLVANAGPGDFAISVQRPGQLSPAERQKARKRLGMP